MLHLGGAGGGEIIAAGTPEEVAASPRSHTGRYPRTILARTAKPAARPRPRPRKASAAR